MPVFNGTAGVDDLVGSAGDDTINGLGGNDLIVTDDGNDVVDGGDGDDEINGYLDDEGSLIWYPSVGSKVIHGGNGDDFVVGGRGSDTLYGDAGDDMLVGREGDDSLVGGAGSDFIVADAGDDTLAGGTGDDILFGGAGNDTYFIGDTGDFVYDTGGSDRAEVSASFAKIPSAIETVAYVGGAQALPYWIDALVYDEASGGYFAALLGTARTFSYYFPATLPDYDTDAGDALGFRPFSDAQVAATLAALQYISGVIDVRFAAGASASAYNTLSFGNNTQPDSGGYGYAPNDVYSGSDVFIARDNTNFADGAYGALTIIHEIGHAIGLKHPHSEGGHASEPPYLPAAEDIQTWTVMSYTDDRTAWHARYSELDIAALQYLYGPSRTARTGNDTYTLSATAPNFVWDGAGTDTIDASALTAGVTLYLAPGYWGYMGAAKATRITAPGQVTVNFGSAIENARGTAFADTLSGNELANQIEGGGGNDTITGGAGIDTALFTGARAGYSVAYDAATGAVTVTDNTPGRDGQDQLREVEQLKFSDRTVSVTSVVAEIGHRSEVLATLGVMRALNGSAPASAAYETLVGAVAGGTTSAFAIDASSPLATLSGEQFASRVMANFGISAGTGGTVPQASFDALKGALEQIFTLFAPARGQVVLNMATLLQGLESDAVFGPVARSWNARVGTDFAVLAGTATAANTDAGLSLVGVADAT